MHRHGAWEDGWQSMARSPTTLHASYLATMLEYSMKHCMDRAHANNYGNVLAILLAIDIWACHWPQSRVVLKVRGDNVGALTLLINRRPANAKQAIIPRELALRLVELSFPPDAVHTPGIAHIVADEHSRVYAPKGTGVVSNRIHPALEHAKETPAPTRNKAWYRALQ